MQCQRCSAIAQMSSAIEGNNNDPRHQPYFGSVLEYLWKNQGISMEATGMPVNMSSVAAQQQDRSWAMASPCGLAWQILQSDHSNLHWPGRPGNWSTLDQRVATDPDPFRSLGRNTPDSTFVFDGTTLPADVTHSRMHSRQKLLGSFEISSDLQSAQASYSFRAKSPSRARDDEQPVRDSSPRYLQPLRTRENYGLSMFGQCALRGAAVEAGVKVVTVFWDTWTDNNAAWDTHHNHHPRLKEGLCPKFDRILPTFLTIWNPRGLLDETLVLSSQRAWPRRPSSPIHPAAAANTGPEPIGVCFWRGDQTGQVIGATDRRGA